MSEAGLFMEYENEAPRESVGALLREMREHYGEDLRDVAVHLRIRHVHLAAIEEGRFDDLPGPTYALGFVRSYAEYLGLDREEIVRRFKEEIAGIERRQQLVFPEPAPESKVPGGAIILVSVILVALAYGGWIYLSNDERDLADFVPEVPERLRSLLGGEDTAAEIPVESTGSRRSGQPQATASGAGQGGEAAGPASPAASSESGGGAGDSSGGETSLAEGQPSAPASAPSEEPEAAGETAAAQSAAAQLAVAESAGSESTDAGSTAAGTEQQPADRAEDATASTTTESAGDAAAPAIAAAASATAGSGADRRDSRTAEARQTGTPGTGTEEQDLASLPQRTDDAGRPLPPPERPAIGGGDDEIPAAPVPGAPEDIPQGQVYGSENETARIVLHATADSWVQVRDQSDEAILTRVLRAGDVYRVPDDQGLTLLTGNAGGLIVVLDGERLPPLGPMGAVRRNIPLTPVGLQGTLEAARPPQSQ